MTTNADRKTVYEIITDKIIALLEKGTVPWRKTWKGGASTMPANFVSKRRYNGVNVFVLYATAQERGYTSPYWLTFNQCRDLGGHVRKGEKGTPVFFWKVYDRATEAEAGPDSEASSRRFVGRYFTVFNVEQCDGLDVAKPEAVPTVPVDPIEACEAIVAGYHGPTIRHGGGKACYSPIGDKVQMPPRDSFEGGAEYYSTLFHELTHSTGHSSRLARFGNTDAPAPFGTPDYSREELIAEMGAAFLCAEAGISNEVIANQASYVANWLKVLKSDPRAVVFAAASARKAAAMILGSNATAEAEKVAA